MSDAPPADSDYRFAPGFVSRVVGRLLVLLAVLLGATTLLVALLGLPVWVLLGVAALAVAGVLVTAYLFHRRLAVLHLGADGYRLRLVRGAGVPAASWREVREAVATHHHGMPVVVLKLTDERSTILPVTVLDTYREEFVRDLQRHLQHGQGLRPLQWEDDGPDWSGGPAAL